MNNEETKNREQVNLSKADLTEGHVTKKTGEKKQSEVIAFIKFLVWMFILVAFIRGSLVEAYRIPSASMRPTLIEQDHILVTKLDYGLHLAFVPTSLVQYALPDRFDIVVFTLEGKPETNYIKRVIALPGETIEVRKNQVFVNGQLQPDPEKVQWLDGGIKDFGPVTVPEGHVFLMGDNRDHSRDSRFWENPFLDVKLIKGRAQIIYFNISSLGRIGTLIR